MKLPENHEERKMFDKGCKNKKRFKSETDALEFIESWVAKNKKSIYWYPCQFCNGYHTTSKRGAWLWNFLKSPT